MASRSVLITVGLVSRKKVLISRSTASVETKGLFVSWPSTCFNISAARLLSGSRFRVKRRLFSM